jgi:hypothetical protein
MGDQLSVQDWLDQGLKTLAKSGFTALKAEPLAKAMGVSRGSFYWHFRRYFRVPRRDPQHWREIAAEQIIAGIEAAARTKIRSPCCCAGCSANGSRSRTRSALGQRRSRGPRRGAGDRPPPSRLCRRPDGRNPDCQ